MLNDLFAKLAPPPPGAQSLLDASFRCILKRHPALFERLGEHQSKTFAILPTGSPYAFVVRPTRKSVKLTPRRASTYADVSVAGDLVALLALLEGLLDGDALFFSRELSVTGDMEAIVALRNALDDAGVDLPHDLSPLAGPFAELFASVAARARNHLLSRKGAGPWS